MINTLLSLQDHHTPCQISAWAVCFIRFSHFYWYFNSSRFPFPVCCMLGIVAGTEMGFLLHLQVLQFTE